MMACHFTSCTSVNTTSSGKQKMLRFENGETVKAKLLDVKKFLLYRAQFSSLFDKYTYEKDRDMLIN